MQDTKRINRIIEMEKHYNACCAGELENISLLREYMDSGLWLSDYEADERGELSRDLRRGVLSQDGLYDLLHNIENKDAP